MVLRTPKDLPMGFIDVRDTGALGARILIDPVPHVGKTYEFTGARTNYGEFADVFSQVLDKPITYVEATLEQTEQALRARGMPDWLVAHLPSIPRITGKGGCSTENAELIRNIAKRPPKPTTQLAEYHKGPVPG